MEGNACVFIETVVFFFPESLSKGSSLCFEGRNLFLKSLCAIYEVILCLLKVERAGIGL